MRSTNFRSAWGLFFFVVQLWCVSGTVEAQQTFEAELRQAAFLKCLREGRLVDSERAADVLAADELPPEMRESIVAAIVKRLESAEYEAWGAGEWVPMIPPQFVDGLVAAGSKELIKFLSNVEDNPQLSDATCLAFYAAAGRLGEDATALLPVLQKRIQQDASGQPKRFECCHAIVALTLDPSDKSAAELIKEFVRSNEEPARLQDRRRVRPPLEYEIELLLHVHPSFQDVQPLGEYIAKSIDEIDQASSEPLYEARGSVIALSFLKFDSENKSKAVKRLQKVFDAALERKSIAALPLGLALARLDADLREETLLKVISPGNIESFAHLGTLMLYESRWSRILVNRDVAVALAKRVENENPEISQSASWLLRMSGLAGGEAAPVLFKVLESDDNQQPRVNAAIALAGICGPSNLPALQAAYNREKVREVRKELDRAILGLRGCDGERLAH